MHSDELAGLLFGCPHLIARDLGVSPKTVKRWKNGATPPPPIIKLLRIRYGDLAGLAGDDWEGFCFGRDGLLYHPFYKYGFTAGEIRGMFFVTREIDWYRKEFVKLRAELAALQENTWAMQKVRESCQNTRPTSEV